MRAPLPPDEEPRLAALREYAILDTPGEANFDGLVRLAAKVTGATAAMLTLVDADRVYVKARFGTDIGETPRYETFCAHVILSDAVLVVDDATRDPRFAALPSVKGPPFIFFYAGAPVIAAAGQHRFGALCVFGLQRRSLDAAQRRDLKALAALAAGEFELSRIRRQVVAEIAERARIEASFREAQAKLRDFLSTATDAIWETDAEHRFSSVWNNVAVGNFDPRWIIGKTRWEAAQGDPQADPAWMAHLACLEARAPFSAFTYALRRPNGEEVWVEASGRPVYSEAAEFRGYRGTTRYITDRKRAARALEEMSRRFEALSNSGIVGIVEGVGTQVVAANAEFLRIVGYDQADLEAGLINRASINDAVGEAMNARSERALRQGAPSQTFEKDYIRKDGGRIPVICSGLFLDQAENRWMGIVQDNSERRCHQAVIWELAHKDELTGLWNRRAFTREVDAAFEQDRAPLEFAALLLLDIDHFKNVNDAFGHQSGDAVLRDVAMRLRQVVDAGHLLARLGGDEFAIFVQCGDTAAAANLAAACIACFRPPVACNGQVLRVSASIGVTHAPQHGRDSQTLLKNADVALYRAKAGGRDRAVVYDPVMLAQIEHRVRLAEELRLAIRRFELRVHYQPIVELESERHAGFEALVRWAHPLRGLLPPSMFIECAEASNLAEALGRHVLSVALAQIRGWLDAGLEPGYVAVNVAVAQLRAPDFVLEVDRLLAQAALDPRRLQLEITENVFLDGDARIAQSLNELHELGVAIALDDFGTGYASLTHLKTYPVDVIKIDRSFVRDIGLDPGDAVISRTIVNLAHSLGRLVVAEGIENSEQLEFLRVCRCDRGQGYLFARPVDAAQVVLAHDPLRA